MIIMMMIIIIIIIIIIKYYFFSVRGKRRQKLNFPVECCYSFVIPLKQLISLRIFFCLNKNEL